MAAVKSKDTAPEIAVRRLVHAMGFRYRLHDASLPGCPDLVFRRLRKIIVVHGCFWHMHGCGRCRIPKARRAYWVAKLHRNAARDRRSFRVLRDAGWKVLVVWECQTRCGPESPPPPNRSLPGRPLTGAAMDGSIASSYYSPGSSFQLSRRQKMATATETAPKTKTVKAPQVKDQPLFIGGKWLDAAIQQDIPRDQPRHRRNHLPGCRGGQGRHRFGRQGRPQGARNRAVEKNGRRGARPIDVQARRPDREGSRRAGRPRIAQLRQDDHRFAGGHARRRQHAPLLRRLGRQDRRPHRSREGQFPQLHAAAAGRRCRPNHPVELPVADVGLEVGPSVGVRQHHRHEAGGAIAAHRVSAPPLSPRKLASPTASST